MRGWLLIEDELVPGRWLLFRAGRFVAYLSSSIGLALRRYRLGAYVAI